MAPFGIEVSVVCPGSLRTDFRDASSMQFPQVSMAVYQDSEVRSVKDFLVQNNHKQEGDPAKVAAFVCEMTERGNLPQRLLIGAKFCEQVKADLEAQLVEMIAEKTGADIFEIKADHAYPKEYRAATEAAKAEKETKARPGLVGTMPDLSKYDVIYLGYPIWWSDMPMAVYTFLEQGNFVGKTIIPFCTHEGNGISGMEDYIKEATGAKVLAGFELRDSIA